eukprot:gene17905-21357_t
MGLLPPDNTIIDKQSRIHFGGRDLLQLSIAERRTMCGKDISMIFQEPMSSLNPVFTVGFQIAEVLRQHMGMNRKQTGEVRQVFESPQDSYTKALLHCRPSLDERPWRLPVIADYMEGKAGPGVEVKQRTRGYTPGDEPVLVVNNLSKSFYTREGLFGKREFQAVKDVSFTLPRGKTLGVVGESGSGKTTVGLTLLRLHQATGGTAMFHGKDLIAMPNKEYLPYKRRIQIIFQNPYASLNPRFTVGQILLEPMRIHNIGANDQERIAKLYRNPVHPYTRTLLSAIPKGVQV